MCLRRGSAQTILGFLWYYIVFIHYIGLDVSVIIQRIFKWKFQPDCHTRFIYDRYIILSWPIKIPVKTRSCTHNTKRKCQTKQNENIISLITIFYINVLRRSRRSFILFRISWLWNKQIIRFADDGGEKKTPKYILCWSASWKLSPCILYTMVFIIIDILGPKYILYRRRTAVCYHE